MHFKYIFKYLPLYYVGIPNNSITTINNNCHVECKIIFLKTKKKKQQQYLYVYNGINLILDDLKRR